MPIDDEKAATQYGELKGTISIDSYGGSFLNELRSHASMPSGYVPVGLSLKKHGKTSQFVLYGADVDVVGIGPDEWRNYLSDHADMAVFEFDIELSFQQMVEIIKRISIKVWHKSLDGAKVRVLEDG